MSELIILFIENDTNEEISIEFSGASAPNVGDTIVYWEDGTPERTGFGTVNRHKMHVKRVEHDFRVMPNRGTGEKHIHSVTVYVDVIEWPGDPRLD